MAKGKPTNLKELIKSSENKESKRNKIAQEQDKMDLQHTEVKSSSKTEVIILPESMTKLKAANELYSQHEAEEKIINKVFIFDKFIIEEALIAIMDTMRSHFGWVDSKPTIGFFGNENPPVEIKIKTSTTEHRSCFLGEFEVSQWEDASGSVGVNHSGAYVSVTVKKRYEKRVDSFFEEILKEIKENSIYKGKTLAFNMTQKYGNLHPEFDFIDNNQTDVIILNPEEQLILDNFVIKPIVDEIPGKRGVLFSGPFGTGKTETAMRIAKLSVERKCTFFYCKDKNFDRLLKISTRFQPAVVFFEDLDQVAKGERTEVVNTLLNTLDGIETKGTNLTVLMTTNNKNDIHPAFRRPGRIDVVLNFDLPEPSTIEQMYKIFLAGVKGVGKLDLARLAKMTPKVQGAVVREIARRAVWLLKPEEPIQNSHLEAAISMAKHQVDFMTEPVLEKTVTIDGLVSSLISKVVEPNFEEIFTRI